MEISETLALLLVPQAKKIHNKLINEEIDIHIDLSIEGNDTRRSRLLAKRDAILKRRMELNAFIMETIYGQRN